jgi:hypothetical protein
MEQNGEASQSVDFHRCDHDPFLQDGIFHKGDMKKLIPKQDRRLKKSVQKIKEHIEKD